jgi:hypothetical protein
MAASPPVIPVLDTGIQAIQRILHYLDSSVERRYDAMAVDTGLRQYDGKANPKS